MKILLYENVNSGSIIRSLENKPLMFYGDGQVLILTDVKIDVVTETTGRGWFKTTRNVTYLTHCNLIGYNSDGDFVGYHTEEYIARIVHSYDLLACRRRFVEFEKAVNALQKHLDDKVAIKAGIHPSII